MSEDRPSDLSLVLELLRQIQTDVRVMREDIRELKLRITTVEHQIAHLVAVEASHYASLSSRMDRFDERLERLERRAGLLAA